MKKFICIILSMIIVFSAFSVTSFATYTPKAEEATKKLDFEKGVSMELSDGNEIYTLYIKNNKFASEMDIYGHNAKTIYADRTFYLYFTAFPFFYFEIKDLEEISIDDLMPDDLEEFEFVRGYQKTSGGKTYDIEIYVSNQNTTSEFCLLDGELISIETYGTYEGNENYYSYLEIISTEVDDKEFKPPFFAINITPIINFFFDI